MKQRQKHNRVQEDGKNLTVIPRAGGESMSMPAQDNGRAAGWIPAFAGMTTEGVVQSGHCHSEPCRGETEMDCGGDLFCSAIVPSETKTPLLSSRTSAARSGIYAVNLMAQTPDKRRGVFRGDGRLLYSLAMTLLAALFLFTSPAHADCVNPAAAAGEIIFNTDDDVLQFCNDSDWVRMGVQDTGITPGNCSNPNGVAGVVLYNADDHVLQACNGVDWLALGPVLPGAAGGGCLNPAGVEGHVMYNADHDKMQYCNSFHWVSIEGFQCKQADIGGVFTDQTDIALSTQTNSNIVQINALGCSLTASISGNGSPQFRICDDAPCGTVDHDWGSVDQPFDSGQYIQLRQTSAATGETVTTAAIEVGTKSDLWTLTTIDAKPDPFNFTNLTGVLLGTQFESDIVQITGISNGIAISVSGGINAEYRICSDGTCSGAPAYTNVAGTINNNQYVQLRQNSATTYSTDSIATLTVGDGISGWTVSTTGDNHVDAQCDGLGDFNIENGSTGHCYWRVDAVDTWTNGKAVCEVSGGHLATIVDATERDYIKDNIMSSSSLYIGATDETVEGEWRWIGGDLDGKQFWQGTGSGNTVNGMYASWNSGEPNALATGSDYAEMRNSDGLWNDHTTTFGQVCEKDDFGFADLAGAAISTTLTSSIHQIEGIGTGIPISISGGGTPEYRICDDDTCATVDHDWGDTSGSIDNDQYLQLRLTTPAGTATNTATITVGISTHSWRVQSGCASGSETLTADGTVSVPSGCNDVTVKAWGAGGGGGQADSSSGDTPGGDGGAGGYAQATFTLNSDNDLNVVVGTGGATGSSYNDSGAGGGYTLVEKLSDNTDLIIVGAGGGGGGGDNSSSQAAGDGGAGGGTTGVSGTAPAGGCTVATGGTQVAGGTGSDAGGSSGASLAGGQGGGGSAGGGTPGGGDADSLTGGGGGGAGYFGGGGGGNEGGGCAASGGGGGGSSFITASFSPASTQNTAGSGKTPPNTGDADYGSGAGVGGDGDVAGGSADGTAGAGGRVVAIWGSGGGGTDDHVDADCTGLGDAQAHNSSTGHCYWRVDTTDTWANAKAACETSDGHLATIVNAAENSYILNNIYDSTLSWIGADDQVVEGEFRWVGGDLAGLQFWQGDDTGNTVGGLYADWATSEPAGGTNTQDCIQYWPGSSDQWDDTGCGNSKVYICEKDDFGFEPQEGVSTFAQTSSNIYQIEGIGTGVSVSVSGSGSPEYRVCSDATCSGAPAFTNTVGTIDNDDYLQLRQIASGSADTITSMTVSVGSSSHVWEIKTAP